LTAKATMAGAAFDAAALWDLEGDTSMTAWLRTRAGMTSRQAARTVTTSRRLAAAPVTAAAWSDGTLSTGQVEAITANVDDATAALFAEHEADLIPVLAAPVRARCRCRHARLGSAGAGDVGGGGAARGEPVAAPVDGVGRAPAPDR
jgi:hypothetical protein